MVPRSSSVHKSNRSKLSGIVLNRPKWVCSIPYQPKIYNLASKYHISTLAMRYDTIHTPYQSNPPTIFLTFYLDMLQYRLAHTLICFNTRWYKGYIDPTLSFVHVPIQHSTKYPMLGATAIYVSTHTSFGGYRDKK